MAYSFLLSFHIHSQWQSSNTTTFLLHEVAKQPELQEKLYQEVSSVLGDRNSPTFDDVQKMTLVRSCIKEILR